jgi:hypothetical protein
VSRTIAKVKRRSDNGRRINCESSFRGNIEDCDPSYAKLLKPLVAQSAKGYTLNYGIKTMPNLWEMELHDEQKVIFEYFGYSSKGWKANDAEKGG